MVKMIFSSFNHRDYLFDDMFDCFHMSGYSVYDEKKRQNEKIAKIVAKLEEVNKELHSGSLNATPLPFEKTLKMIEASRNELIEDKKDSHSYALMRLFRNITPEEREIATQLEVGEEPLVDELALALYNGEWDSPIFTSPRFGQYVLQAFIQKRISIEQLTTVFLRWEATEQFSNSGNLLWTRSVFENGTLSEDAKKFLLPALWKMSADEEARFVDILGKSPKSEQYFWTVKVPKEDYEKGNKQKNFGKMLDAFQGRFRLFTLIKSAQEPDQAILVVPSFSIIQAYLRGVYMEHAVTMIPEFGIGTPEQIEFDIPQNKRLFALHFPGIKGLEEGDGYYFGKYLSSFHDFYHSQRISLIPYPRRLAYLRLSHVFNHCLTLSENCPNQPLLTVYWTRDCSFFTKNVGEVYKFAPIKIDDRSSFQHKYYESNIDLERPATEGYVQLFRERESCGEYTNKDYPLLAEKLPFVPFYAYHMWLEGATPERYFDVCVALHDMVVHNVEWKNHFGIETMKTHHWHENDRYSNIQKKLIEGFSNKTISTPPEQFDD